MQGSTTKPGKRGTLKAILSVPILSYLPLWHSVRTGTVLRPLFQFCPELRSKNVITFSVWSRKSPEFPAFLSPFQGLSPRSDFVMAFVPILSYPATFRGFRSKNVIPSGSRTPFPRCRPFLGPYCEVGDISRNKSSTKFFEDNSRIPGRKGAVNSKNVISSGFRSSFVLPSSESPPLPPASIREMPRFSPEPCGNARHFGPFPDNFGIHPPIPFQKCHTFPGFPAGLGTSYGRNWVPILSSLRFAGQNPEKCRTILDSAAVRSASQPCPGRIPDPSGQEGQFRSISVPVFFRIPPPRIPETATTCSAPCRGHQVAVSGTGDPCNPPRSRKCPVSSLLRFSSHLAPAGTAAWQTL